MRITKIEMAAIGITLVLLSLVFGFFLGRNTTDSTVIHADPEPVEVSAPVEAVAEPKAITVESTEESAEFDSLETAGLLDINRATAVELETLPGIGQVLAQRIVAYRESVGGFTSVEELKNVEGIGDKKFDAILNLIEVGKEYENSGS